MLKNWWPIRCGRSSPQRRRWIGFHLLIPRCRYRGALDSQGRFLRGAELTGYPVNEVASFLGRYRVIWPDEETLCIYARIYAELFRSNQIIGPHDLWIAASVLRANIPLITRNAAEFRRVPNLRVENYTVIAWIFLCSSFDPIGGHSGSSSISLSAIKRYKPESIWNRQYWSWYCWYWICGPPSGESCMLRHFC